MSGLPAAPDWYERGLRHLWLPYTQTMTAPRPLAVARTSGSRIHLEDGRELIDGIASWWTACHGYNHPYIAAAVARQLERMPHVMLGGLVHEPAATLCRRLAAWLPGDLDYVFLSDSGSVAVEVAMKMAVQFWLNQGVRGRTRFLAFEGGYHGDTFAAMSVCDPDEGMHTLFRGVLPEQLIAPLPRDDRSTRELEALMDRHGASLAAILVEPSVQGAGGMLFHGREVLQRLRRIASDHGVLLIFDEIFTGFGRTGSLFACLGADTTPDIITLGKALSGGTLPLAATVASRRVHESFCSDQPGRELMHGPTFMGNALACAAANASLDLFDREDRLAEVQAVEHALDTGLAPCRHAPGVRDVRVRGAIGVVELEDASSGALAALSHQLIAAGVWVRPFRNIVYLTPALNIDLEDLDRLTSALRRALHERRPT